jgi:hypothetical protein
MIYLTFLIGSLLLSLVLFAAGLLFLAFAKNKALGFLALVVGMLFTFFPTAIYLALSGLHFSG